jgi:lipopolysaccharide/colanic/teichoic acid biosynthesis glycosyltransferase
METAKELNKVYPIQAHSLSGVDESVRQFLSQYTYQFSPETTAIVDIDNRLTLDIFKPKSQNVQHLNCVVNLRLVNRIRHIVPFFEGANDNLGEEGIFISCLETAEQRKKRLYNKIPKGFRTLYYTFDYIGKRVVPKLPILKKIYYFLTAGRNRVLSRVEVLGRLIYCGFKIIAEKEIENRTYLIVQKEKSVVGLQEKNYGLLFKMKRHGHGGKMINVYKFRSMYAYSEYLQEYIYQQNQLAEGGKFKEDFRVNMLGKLIRKFWIDEIPMIYNLFKGDIKLVGVRPLSKHYLSLYGEEFAEKRKQFKPGLIPPYYADLPNTIEEIVASEKAYFEAYQKAPLKTDVRYFFKCFGNIILRKARSN